MSLIRNYLIITNFLLVPFAWATPSIEILQSCKNAEPANNSISMEELDAPGVEQTVEAGCEEKYELTYNHQKFGSITCNNEGYLIINSNRIKLTSAANFSVNPAVKPDTPLLLTAQYWKITKENESYLCVASAIDQSGSRSGSAQYYIAENAFNSDPVSLYFYYFDRESLPLTSMN
ncbi:hypothetical protein DIZ81_13960 [Legionella taurinensis]|uniref:Uncharacterized protein n=1 Tax=Legionella taurinensis TaxID=70611 RepID=A0AB38N370_9GAMM|nr:hypothetical protein [Legionella taurinensis]MDX1838860.1 hypothetical protein [Legionella taurinensis]PUT38550.1 hypothetical protein DB744_13970 [Legionella taurinensis]PUT39318.1 hypothetical protein DB746_14000 [Legionella taurinensis]PUT41042.1 hypothetical protein DB743_13980 [Legionella taurinensis]PUT44472.1 hypothetical protein DB745_14000 [Legionella taurinensis]